MTAPDPETQILRQISQNFALPLFYRRVDPGIVSKASSDESLGESPVGLADVGVQILFTRERRKRFPNDPVFGEEFVPPFSKESQAIVDAYDISQVLTTEKQDARAFLKLLRDIIASNKTLPKSTIENYCPMGPNETIMDPIDGTVPFSENDPRFSAQVARTDRGRLTAGWIYRPVQDVMFRRIGEGPSEYVTFDKETGKEHSRPLLLPQAKPLSEMTVVYSRAHPSVPLDDATRPIYEQDGQRLSFEKLAVRFENTFKAVVPTDGYSFHHGELFLGNVDAFCGPCTFPWDHFAQAYIAQGIGFRVGFLDGQDYLGPNGEIPFVLGPTGKERVPLTGGVLYAHPQIWDELNRALSVKHHPLKERMTSGERRFHIAHLG